MVACSGFDEEQLHLVGRLVDLIGHSGVWVGVAFHCWCRLGLQLLLVEFILMIIRLNLFSINGGPAAYGFRVRLRLVSFCQSLIYRCQICDLQLQRSSQGHPLDAGSILGAAAPDGV